MSELLAAILLLVLACIAATAGLRRIATADAAVRSREQLERDIDELLPQTQCGKCGYRGCRPYARGIVAGEADINQCPPGGSQTIRQLARLLGRDTRPLDTRHGHTQPPRVAVIDEDLCIGCKKCITACPVDAIIGAPKVMHTVIPEQCTGCELCLPPCPVDCISMVAASTGFSSSGTSP